MTNEDQQRLNTLAEVIQNYREAWGPKHCPSDRRFELLDIEWLISEVRRLDALRGEIMRQCVDATVIPATSLRRIYDLCRGDNQEGAR